MAEIPAVVAANWEPISIAPLPAQPLVSVLMASYNYAEFIGDAIESVLKQSYSRLELVVCDDGSTDESVRIVRAYARRDHRVRLVSKPNGGQASALNAAYALSRGKIVCFLDADDLFALGKLTAVLGIWKTVPNAGMVGHSLMRITREGTELGVEPETGKLVQGWIAKAVHSRGGRWVCPPTSGICIHRTLAQLVFPIPEQLFPISPDWFIFTLAPLLSVITAINAPLGYYRMHSSNAQRLIQFRAAPPLDARQHWGPIQLGLITLDREVRESYARIDAVNLRLTDLGHPERVLVPAQDLHLIERILMLEMVKASSARRTLLRRWISLTLRLARDRESGLLHRLFMPPALAAAIVLPRAARASFLSRVAGRAQWKVAIRAIPRKLDRWQRQVRGNRQKT